MHTTVLILNIFGLNCISRFITGHIGTGILVLLIDIFSIVFISNPFGWILLIVGGIIYIVDLITVCTGNWECDGQCLNDWGSGSRTSYNVNYNVNINKDDDEIKPLFLDGSNNYGNVTRNVTPIIQNETKCQNCGKSNSGGYSTCPYCGADALVSPSACINPTIIVKNEKQIENTGKDVSLEQNNEMENVKDNQLNGNYFIGKNWKDILTENKLDEYTDTFEKNKLLDFLSISELDETDLEKLGITIMGDRKRILILIIGVKSFLKKIK